jgi:tetratricopeptide (TPR) repeat protein
MLRNLAGLFTAKPGSSRAQRREYAQRALELLRRIGEPGAEADALYLCGDSYRVDGDYPRALSALREAVDTASAAGHDAGVLQAWQQIAIVYREQGDYARAVGYAEKCVELARRLGSSRDLGVSLLVSGIIHRELGDPPRAETCFQQGIAVCTAADDRAQLAYLLAHLGQLYARQRHPAARPTLERAESLCRSRNLTFGLAISMQGLGEVALAEQDYPAAAGSIAEAVRLLRRCGYRFALARSLKCLGIAHSGLGSRHEAGSAWREAHQLYVELGNPAEVDELAQLLETIGRLPQH